MHDTFLQEAKDLRTEIGDSVLVLIHTYNSADSQIIDNTWSNNMEFWP